MPKLIVATCPHCMNAIGKEYRQVGGNFKAMHHTEYPESLVTEGKFNATALPSSVTYHDPCYLAPVSTWKRQASDRLTS
jgi:Fe-S oxidoreductase